MLGFMIFLYSSLHLGPTTQHWHRLRDWDFDFDKFKLDLNLTDFNWF